MISYMWIDECTTCNSLLDFRPYIVNLRDEPGFPAGSDEEMEEISLEVPLHMRGRRQTLRGLEPTLVEDLYDEDDDDLAEFDSDKDDAPKAVSRRRSSSPSRGRGQPIASPSVSLLSPLSPERELSDDSDFTDASFDPEDRPSAKRSRPCKKASRPGQRGERQLTKEHQDRFYLLEQKLRKWVKPDTKQNRGEFIKQLPIYVGPLWEFC